MRIRVSWFCSTEPGRVGSVCFISTNGSRFRNNPCGKNFFVIGLVCVFVTLGSSSWTVKFVICTLKFNSRVLAVSISASLLFVQKWSERLIVHSSVFFLCWWILGVGSRCFFEVVSFPDCRWLGDIPNRLPFKGTMKLLTRPSTDWFVTYIFFLCISLHLLSMDRTYWWSNSPNLPPSSFNWSIWPANPTEKTMQGPTTCTIDIALG